MHHLLGDLVQVPKFCVHQHIRLPIISLTRGQKLPDFCEWICVAQLRSMLVRADSLVNLFRGGPKTNHEGVRLQACQISFIQRKPSTGCDDRSLSSRQFLHHPAFQLTKSGFAIFFEDIGDGPAGAALNDMIRIQESEMKPVCRRAANGRFAGSHEPNQCKVMNQPAFQHGK